MAQQVKALAAQAYGMSSIPESNSEKSELTIEKYPLTTSTHMQQYTWTPHQ